MRKKGFHTFLFSLQYLILVLIICTCVQGIADMNSWNGRIRYVESIVRCLAIYFFSIGYFSSMTSDSGPESLFIPLYLLFNALSEIRIFGTFTDSFQFTIIPQLQGTNIFLFSVFAMMMSIIGYGLFYNNRNADTVVRYQLTTIIASAILAYKIPKTPDYFISVTELPIAVLINILALFALIVLFILLFRDKDRNDRIRHLAAMLLTVGSFLNIFYDSFLMNMFATAFMFVGLTFITIIAKLNEVSF